MLKNFKGLKHQLVQKRMYQEDISRTSTDANLINSVLEPLVTPN